jgi:fumarate reductase flavoprotein subunit
MLCFFALSAMLWTGTAITQEKKSFTADRHKERGLTCDACHKEATPKAAASAAACLTCHKTMEAVAERTKDFERNPHKNHLVESNDVECTECHHGHKANMSLCDQCHTGFKFEKKQAAAK